MKRVYTWELDRDNNEERKLQDFLPDADPDFGKLDVFDVGIQNDPEDSRQYVYFIGMSGHMVYHEYFPEGTAWIWQEEANPPVVMFLDLISHIYPVHEIGLEEQDLLQDRIVARVEFGEDIGNHNRIEFHIVRKLSIYDLQDRMNADWYFEVPKYSAVICQETEL